MIELKPLPFDEAIRFFRDKGLAVSPLSWRDVWADANVRAFTVARVAAMDVLEDIRREVDRAVRSGVTLQDFKASLAETLARKGWWTPPLEKPEEILPDGMVRKRLTPWRLDTIFRTNVQSAYNTGRYRQMIENAPRRPWWLYDAVNDARTRPAHAAMDGKVFRFDHPIWDKWYPPNGFNCRCTVRALSDRDMERRGLRESTRPPADRPDEGFDYNPGRVKWQPDFNRYAPRARHLLQSDLSDGSASGPLPLRNRPDIAAVLTQKLGHMLPNGVRDVRFADAKFLMATDSRGGFVVSTRPKNLTKVGGPAAYRADRMLESGLRALGRRPLTFDEEYALESFWHECLHNLQVEARDRTAFYAKRYPDSRVLMETVTQWTARRTYHQMLDALGGYRPSLQDDIIRRGYAYRHWVRNLESLRVRVGIGESQLKAACAEVMGSVPRDQYEDALVERLTARGALQPDREFVFRLGLQCLRSDPKTFAETVLAFLE
jgi:SPP1 gp7 family putative phage head morphogenesis protein